MPTPLTAKGIAKLSLVEQVMAVISIGIPLAGLTYFLNSFSGEKHDSIRFENPWLNLGAHASLILCPLIWVWLINWKPVMYESSDSDINLGRSSYLSRWPINWWMMLMMWATPVFIAVGFGQFFNSQLLPHFQDLNTSFGKAILIMVTILLLGCFYATLLLGRSEPATRVSDEGLRTGILRFYKWEDIHHVSRHGNLYAVFHLVNPALPATSFKLGQPESRAILEEFLSRHHIQISNDSQPAYLLVQVAVLLGFAANLSLDFWLRRHTSLSFTSVILISFGMGIFLTVLLEKYRGVSAYGKYKPVIQLEETEGKQL